MAARETRTPAENYQAILKIAREVDAMGLSVSDREEALLSLCFKAFGPAGYDRQTVLRALAAIERARRADVRA